MAFANLPRQRLVVLIFAILCGVAAVGLAIQWRNQQVHKLTELEKTLRENYRDPVEVVVAAKDLAEGTLLDISHLAKAMVPEKFVQPYAVRNPSELLGKTIVAPMAEGEQILATKVRPPDEVPSGTTLSSLMPKGRRGVTITVDAITGVGGFVRPGDMVDVLWTVKQPSADQQEGQVVTLTLFQDVPVLAVGQEAVGGRLSRPKEPQASAQDAQQPSTVTLALTPHETALLLYVREQGRIQLSLRPRADKGQQVEVPPASMSTLMQSVLGKDTAAPPPKPPRNVEVYKGLERSVVSVNE